MCNLVEQMRKSTTKRNIKTKQTNNAHLHLETKQTQRRNVAQMMDFFGTYNHRIDAKGRVALPSKFRKAYERAEIENEKSSTELVVTTSPAKANDSQNECLFVFTVEDFNTWINSLFEVVGGFNPRNREHELQMLALHANVEDLSIDSAGRINIPQKFRDAAGLDTEVSIVGNSGHFEIWDAKRMEQKLSEIDLESLLYD